MTCTVHIVLLGCITLRMKMKEEYRTHTGEIRNAHKFFYWKLLW